MKQVWRTQRAGSIRRLQLLEEPLPQLESDKIRVEVKSVGLNFADIFALTGLYSATPKGSFIPGLEFAGVVSEAGTEARGFATGDRVMGVTRFGGYTTAIDQKPAYCMALPSGWTFAQGAAFPAQTLTAWYALKELGNLQPHHNVLIQSAAGGVGLRAMQICRKLGAWTLGTVGAQSKKEFLATLGFHDVIVRDANFSAAVKQRLQNRELHIVLEAIGGRYVQLCYDLLAPAGRLIVFGAAQFTPGKNRPRYFSAAFQYLTRPKIDPLQMISENKSVLGFNLIWLWDRLDLLLPMLAELRALDLEPPYVGKSFPFAEAHAAIDFLRKGESVGKVVLVL